MNPPALISIFYGTSVIEFAAMFYSHHTCCWDLMLPLCLDADCYYVLQLISCSSWKAQGIRWLRNFLSTLEPSPRRCCHLGSSFHSHVHSFSPMNIQVPTHLPCICVCARVCVCVCVFVIPSCYFTLLFSFSLLILSFQWIQLVLFAPLAIKQFPLQHSNESLSLFHCDCCYV